SKSLERRVSSWCAWFKKTYPSEDPIRLSESQKWDVDFRIFFLVYPIPGAAFLRFVDSCYEVDELLCGTSEAGLRKIEEWRTMDQFKYLLSNDPPKQWEAELCKLIDDIENDVPN